MQSELWSDTTQLSKLRTTSSQTIPPEFAMAPPLWMLVIIGSFGIKMGFTQTRGRTMRTIFSKTTFVPASFRETGKDIRLTTRSSTTAIMPVLAYSLALISVALSSDMATYLAISSSTTNTRCTSMSRDLIYG
ncbi:MAG: hypothetical protein V1735_07860 [Nanoarchaeota archaeon]